MYESPSPEREKRPEHEKTSRGLVGGFAFVLAGAMIAFIVISIVGLILRVILGLSFIGLLSPLYEEPLKAIGLIVLAVFFPGTFKSKKEGAILGALAGILFGIFEIFDFMALYQSFVSAGIINAAHADILIFSRVFTSLPMHAIASLLFGLGTAYAAMGRARPGLRDIFSGNALTFLILSVGFHLIYNLCNIVPTLLAGSDFVGILFAFVIVLAGLYVTYRIYEFIPHRLEQLPAIGARELLVKAMGWGAGGAPASEKTP